MLSAAEFIAGNDHWRALGKQQGREEVTHLPHAQGIDFRVFGGAFGPAVPGQVIAGPVLVVFVVVLVVLLVVRHQVAQGEAVVGSDEVDRRIRPATTVVEHVARAGHACGEIGQLALVALPEGAHGVTEAVVPLSPAGCEIAHLVTTRATVPWLGNQLDLTQQRVLAAGHQEAVTLTVAFVVATQNGRQVEAEAVDMHLACPVTQRIGHQLQDARMAQVQGVAGARVVDVVTLVVRHQPIVGGVVDAAHGKRRAHLVAFGGVVVDHIEDQLQARVVQVRHHLLEFGDLAAGQVAWVRREERDGVVAPIVVQTFVEQVLIVDEGMDGQQLDAGNAQVLDVFEQLVVGQACEGALQVLRHSRVALADALGVGLVHDGLVPRGLYTVVPAPGECGVDDLALGHEGGAVALVERQVTVWVANGVAK